MVCFSRLLDGKHRQTAASLHTRQRACMQARTGSSWGVSWVFLEATELQTMGTLVHLMPRHPGMKAMSPKAGVCRAAPHSQGKGSGLSVFGRADPHMSVWARIPEGGTTATGCKAQGHPTGSVGSLRVLALMLLDFLQA